MTKKSTAAESILAAAYVCGVFAVAYALGALYYQYRGTATYDEFFHEAAMYSVRREESPGDFKRVVIHTWKTSGCCLAVTVVAFVAHRKVKDHR
jgi:hypothetical protein